MMRIIWLTICCILVSISHVQARDSGFNPFNVMEDMFDSDDRRDRRRHRPPPPPPPPFTGYGRPPVPHAAPVPRPQAPISQPAQTARPAWGYQPQPRQPAPPAPAPQPQASGMSSPAPAPTTAEVAPDAPIERPAPSRPNNRVTNRDKAVITRGEDDKILINGRPAVFRPMNLGSEEGAE